jgi:hypothetical protein
MFSDGRLRVPSTSSLAGAGTSTQKGTHRAFIEIFLKIRRASGSGAADGSLKRGRGCGCGQSRNKLLNRVGASSV